MLFWFVAALLTLGASLAVLLPLAGRSTAGTADGAHDLEVYRDQLAELDRDAARGLIQPTEAGFARAAGAVESDGVAIGGHRVAVAPQSRRDRRQHVPAAPVVGIGREMRLCLRHEFVDRAVGRILLQTRGERLRRQVGRSYRRLDAPTDQRDGEHGGHPDGAGAPAIRLHRSG